MEHDGGPTPSPTTLEESLDKWGRRLYDARKRAVEERGIDTEEYNRDLTEEEVGVTAHLADALSVTLLGVGAGRVAFAFDEASPYAGKVVKFARYGEDEVFDGKEQNGWEAGLWEAMVENDADERLLPIVDGSDDALWVIQPEVTPLDESDDIEQSEAVNRATELRRELFSLSNHLDISEISTHNTGMWNGRAHLFDYGRPPREEPEQ